MLVSTAAHSDSKTLEVAVGVVTNAEGQVLISLRDLSLHQGGLWEFPGGKIEAGESAAEALRRELKEELDITVQAETPLITIHHRYPDRTVNLSVFRVERFLGTARHSGGQPLRWVALSELSRYRFPAANRAIVTAARLPSRYAILDDAEEARLFDNLNKILTQNVRLIQARLKSLSKNNVETFIAKAYPLCQRHGAELLINSDAVMADPFASTGAMNDSLLAKGMVDGLHLTSRHLLALEKRPEQYQWVAASCHNLRELIHAQTLGLDFVVLAPVLPTKTHPDARPLGWQQFSEWVAVVNIPVYALGGLSQDHLSTARLAGAQGIAGIRAFLQ